MEWVFAHENVHYCIFLFRAVMKWWFFSNPAALFRVRSDATPPDGDHFFECDPFLPKESACLPVFWSIIRKIRSIDEELAPVFKGMHQKMCKGCTLLCAKAMSCLQVRHFEWFSHLYPVKKNLSSLGRCPANNGLR